MSATFSKPVVGGHGRAWCSKTPTGATVAGATAYDATTRTVTFTPAAPLAGSVSYTATLTRHRRPGQPVSAGGTWSFTTARPPDAPGVCPCTHLRRRDDPTLLEAATPAGDAGCPVHRRRTTAWSRGVRFYKGPNNTGTHTGTLWSPGGGELATGTFTDESTSGWRTSPSPRRCRSPRTTSTPRRTAPRWAATPPPRTPSPRSDLSRPPLAVTATAGAYTYGAGFPSSSSPSSYLVDVVFDRATPTAHRGHAQYAGSRCGRRGSGRPDAVLVLQPRRARLGPGDGDRGRPRARRRHHHAEPDGTLLTFTPAGAVPADTTIAVSLSAG